MEIEGITKWVGEKCSLIRCIHEGKFCVICIGFNIVLNFPERRLEFPEPSKVLSFVLFELR